MNPLPVLPDPVPAPPHALPPSAGDTPVQLSPDDPSWPLVSLLEDHGAPLPLVALAHALPTLLFALTADRRRAYVNRHWLLYTGLPDAQALGARWRQLVHPDDRHRLRQEWQGGGAPEAQAFEAEFRLLDAQGRHRWHQVRMRCVADGARAYWVGHLVEVDARKRAEHALARCERELRTLVDDAPDGITRLDAGMRHVQANAALLGAFGVSAMQLLGRTADEAGLPAEVASAWREAAREAFETGLEQGCEFSTPSGDGADDRHHFLCRLIPEPDETGEVETVLCIAYDITHRRRALAALQDSEQRFRQFAQSSDDVFWFADLAQGRVLYVSPAFERLWGVPAAPLQAVPAQWSQAVPEEDRALLPAPFFLSEPDAAGHEPVREYRVRRGDGSLRWIRDRRFALQSHEGKVQRIGGIVEDITERKLRDLEREDLLARERAARGEAEALASAKDEFLAVVSHELRSPLNAIRGWAHVMRKTAQLPPEQLRPLDAIDRNVAAQARMVDDLLDTQRLLRGKVKLDIHRTALPALIDQAVEAFRPQAADKGITLAVHAAPDLPWIDVDAERLRQCLVNLLSNALKFTPPGGHVSVHTARLSPQRAAIRVSDTGVGLEPQQAQKVFEPFRQGSTGSSSTRRQGGLGLGLALARQLVELHGGRLGVHSDGPDHGATFTIELPAPPPEVAAALPVEHVGGGPAPALADRRVMVLDDDPESRQILELLLRDEQVQAVFFPNAQEGFAYLERVVAERRPEVLISDIAMPGEDGYSLIARVREMHRDRGEAPLPAVALTAFASATDRRRALAAGFDAHLGKPLDPELLRATLRDLLRSAPPPPG